MKWAKIRKSNLNVNSSVLIRYCQQDGVKGELKIYDVLGQEVRTLVNENKSAGYYSDVWDGRDNLGNAVSSGAYFYQLKAANNNFSLTRKLLFLK